MNNIVSILPKNEGFSPQKFGAIALCVQDFTRHSRYHDNTVIIGGATKDGFKDINYTYIKEAKWHENRTRSYAKGCIKFIKENQVDLAEIHNRPELINLLYKKVGCKLALHLHNDPQEMRDAHTPIERESLLQKCDTIYCVSEYIRERFMEGLPAISRGKLHVIYNGITISEPSPKKENLIIFVGRMTEGKGALLLAEALTIALPKITDWQAVLIGSRRHETNNSLTEYEKKVAHILKPLAKQVQLPGFLSHEQTMQYFARSSIAVIPSLWNEPFGRTAIEAMSESCAIISSARGGLREITDDCAINLKNLSAETLAEAILLLAKDEAQRQLFQHKAYQRVAYFSIAERTNLLDKVRQSLLTGIPYVK